MNEAMDDLVARLSAIDPALAAEVAALAASLAEANQLRTAFLQNLSHEVRTPVTVMRGLLDVLAEDVGQQLSEEQRDLIDRVRHSSRQVLDLIEGVLNLSKAEVGMHAAERSRVFVPDLFADLARDVESELAKKGVRLVVDVPRGIDWIVVDGRLLQALVARLLSNAVKFTSQGEVALRARLLGEVRPLPAPSGVRAPEPSGNTLEIVVEDTGRGIAPEIRAKLFEPFRQADGSRTRHHEGLGIGLAVARRMAESLGGTIALDAREGGGTVARVAIPIAAVDREDLEIAAPTVSRVSPAPPLGSPGLLTDLANLALVSPASEAEAIAFALDLVDRLLRPEVCVFVSTGGGTATIVDLIGHGEHGLGPGSPAPLAGATLVRLATERRAIQESRSGARTWIANAVFVDESRAIGVVAARLAASEASTDDLKLVQIAAGWLGREIAKARADRERDELLATLGRDVKNPLGAALAHTQALVRGLRGTLADPQRRTILELERAVHRVILTTLDLLDYHRVTNRGFEVVRQPFSLVEAVDHVLSRQAASIELAEVTVDKRIEEPLPRCSGDLIRSDRAIAIVLRTLLLELDAGGTIALRAFAEPTAVALEIRAPAPERRVLVETLAADDPPLLLGESLGPRLARGWVEAQGGSVEARADASGVRILLRFPRLTD